MPGTSWARAAVETVTAASSANVARTQDRFMAPLCWSQAAPVVAGGARHGRSADDAEADSRSSRCRIGRRPHGRSRPERVPAERNSPYLFEGYVPRMESARCYQRGARGVNA